MRTRSLVALLLIALLVGACSAGTTSLGAASPPPSGPASAIAAHAVPLGATASVDDATWGLTERIAAPAYTGDSTDAFTAALARAGIAVVADTSTDPATAAPEVPLTGTPSPVELLDFQAHALAVGAWAGAAWTGAELDGLAPLPADSGSPTLAQLLDGYVGSADTPGGALARALMAGVDLRDPAAVRFPAVVLFLFVSDVATDGGQFAAPSASPSGAAMLLPLARPGPVVAAPAVDLGLVCSGPSGWIDAVVSRIESAISLAVPQNAAGAIIVAAVNWLINTVASVVKTLINALVGPVLSLIRGIVALAAGIAEQIASLLPYAVHVTVSGGAASGTVFDPFNLAKDPQFGAYDVSVSAGDLPSWPQAIATCARAAGVTLPDFSTKDAPTTFGPIAVSHDPTPLLFRGSGAVDATVTDASGQAHWPFVVGADPGQGKGTYAFQYDQMTVAVHRKELDELRASLTQALFGGLPQILKPYLNAILAPILDRLQDAVNKLLDARGTATAALFYHLPSPSPSPSTTPSGSGGCGVSLPAGTYTGTITSDSTTIVPQGQIDLGESGGTNDHATGPLTVTVGPDGTLGGTFSLTNLEHAEYHGPAEGTTDKTIQEQGAGVSGTLCSLTLTFASETETACRATGQAPIGSCGTVGAVIPLAGLVPPLPLGAPKSVAGGTLTWSLSSEHGFDAGFGGLTSEVQSTITVTLSAP